MCNIRPSKSKGVKEMRKLSLALAATVACVIWAGGAFAQATTTSAAPATPAAAVTTTATAANTASIASQPNDDEVVCETEPPPTGSLIGTRRNCMTRRQWKAREAQTQVGQDLHREFQSSMGAQ